MWSAPTTDAELKKRIVGILIHEVVADIDDATSEIVLILHWADGAHDQMRRNADACRATAHPVFRRASLGLTQFRCRLGVF
ncbi:hypothetical protein [Bosea massiliensis]|uniref:Uncharacterized protein n=1 Tax=Bosea massiliensis TaxID=151419 RepID=A0ABW0P8F6_9HYPH